MTSQNIITFIGTKEEQEIVNRFLDLIENLNDEDYENIEKVTRSEKTFYDKINAISENFEVE